MYVNTYLRLHTCQPVPNAPLSMTLVFTELLPRGGVALRPITWCVIGSLKIDWLPTATSLRGGKPNALALDPCQ